LLTWFLARFNRSIGLPGFLGLASSEDLKDFRSEQKDFRSEQKEALGEISSELKECRSELKEAWGEISSELKECRSELKGFRSEQKHGLEGIATSDDLKEE